MKGCSCESVKDLGTENVPTWGDSNPQPSDSCWMLYPLELSGPHICCPIYLNTGSGFADIFEVKLTFEMLAVRGQQYLFLTHQWVLLWKCQRFRDIKCLDLTGLEPPTFGFMLNALPIWVIRARHWLSHVFEYWLWWYRYFWSKVNIWNAFISTHQWMFLWKCWRFRARHLLSHVFE